MNSHLFTRPMHLAALVACVLPLAVPASQLVYLAEQDHIYVIELYLADLERPDAPVKLNKALSNRADGVLHFAVSPDGTRVAFTADQDARGDRNLYLVDLAALGSWTRLGSLGSGWREAFVRFSPDGSKVAFTATDKDYGNPQLHVVDLANPTVSARLNPPLVADGYVSLNGFEFTPDGRHVVYGAAQERMEVDLYLVDVAAPGVSTRLNGPGGSVGDPYAARFQITPDGSRVVYSAADQTPYMLELHMVSLAAPGTATRLNAPPQFAGDVRAFSLSPDGRYVAYTADHGTYFRPEVYLVDLDAPGIATRISGPVQYSATLAQFTPDARHLLYCADEERGPFEQDLYKVSVDDPAQRVRLNAPLGPGESVVDWYAISPDGVRIAYTPQSSESFFKTDLMLVELASPGAAVRVNEPLPDVVLEAGAIFGKLAFSPDGEEIVYLAVDLAREAHALYFARPSDPGTSTRVGKPLPADAYFSSVDGFIQFLPAGAPRVVPPPVVPAPPSAPAPGQSSGGGGSLGIGTLLLLLLMACVGARLSNRSLIGFAGRTSLPLVLGRHRPRMQSRRPRRTAATTQPGNSQ